MTECALKAGIGAAQRPQTLAIAADRRDGKDVAPRPETDLQSCLKDLLYGADLNFLLWRPRALAGPMGRVAGGSARKEKFTFYRPAPRPRA